MSPAAPVCIAHTWLAITTLGGSRGVAGPSLNICVVPVASTCFSTCVQVAASKTSLSTNRQNFLRHSFLCIFHRIDVGGERYDAFRMGKCPDDFDRL